MQFKRKLPSITALQAFESAARLGSFTLASEELHLAQSAISRQVRGLEDYLGAGLFDLIRQRIVLTQTGQIFLEEVRPVLASLSASCARVSAYADGVQLIEMATLPTFCSRWLIPRLPDYYAKNQRALISFTSKFDPFDFDAEPFDLAIHFGKPDWPDATMCHLFDEHMVAVCSPAFKQEHQIRSDKDLAAAPLLHMSLRRAAWLDWCEQLSLPTENAVCGRMYDQFSMLTEAAAAGLGAALIPDLFIEEELRTGKLVIASQSVLESDSGYYLAIPEHRPTPPAVEALRDWLIAEAASSAKARMPAAD